MGSDLSQCRLNMESLAAAIARELAKQLRFEMAPEALLTAADIATLMRCTPTYISNVLTKRPGFPIVIRIGGHTRGRKRWKRREVAAWINKQAQASRARATA
jgi:predicted DNA-binding transcriptional regulator AlpA